MVSIFHHKLHHLVQFGIIHKSVITRHMKKYLFIALSLALVSSYSIAATDYAMYYKDKGSWQKGQIYPSFSACENAREYHWAGRENTYCVIADF